MLVSKIEYQKTKNGIIATETKETVEDPKNFTEELLKRIAKKMGVDYSDLLPKEINPEPVVMK